MSISESGNQPAKPASDARARASAQREKSSRMLRTILLGTVAMVAGVLWLGEQYGVDRQETLDLLMASAGFVLLLAVTGIAGAVVIWVIRRLSKKP